MLAFWLLVIGVVSRLVVHAWNFTPVIALALFGGVYLKKKQALILPLALLAVSDIILGFHETMFFTWGTILLIVGIGFWVRKNKNLTTVVAGGLASAVLFFITTNFGVWLVSGMYPMTWAGLTECFVLAMPFFRNELLSTFIYGVVLFGGYEAVAAWAKNTRLSHVL
ncbi:MAG: hypothetical protein A3C36_03495 [Omnitrophica WOR_2 bacterium RIFCSPHIGHO2_02_FULL_52_10]|nr:MAG: hypothetical protein A3C36_03495 [Omnitrophica WOR_2 bacterium RIFCSPHIGHO2_02_FULL_52_10]